MFKFINWRTRMCAPDAGGAAGEQAPGSIAAPAGPQSGTLSTTPQPAQGQPAPQPARQPLTTEQRHENAARRRDAETRELQELRAAREEADRVAKSRGYKDFAEFARVSDDDLLKRALKEGTLTAETLRLIMQPVVQQTVQPILEAQEGELQQRDVQDELAEFNKLYSDEGIKEITDFANKPYLPKMRELIDKGLSLVEAYEVANRDALRARQTAAARQAALNDINGKAHLTPVAGAGESLDNVQVPLEVMKTYRRMLPKWSDKQIRDHYIKTLKGQ
jgi:hypothetical protein